MVRHGFCQTLISFDVGRCLGRKRRHAARGVTVCLITQFLLVAVGSVARYRQPFCRWVAAAGNLTPVISTSSFCLSDAAT